MKLLTILTLFLTAIAARARSVSIAWEANQASDQVTAYYVYEMVGAGWTKIGETTEPRFTIGDREPGYYQFAVTAVNYWGESIKSDPVATPGGRPMPPTGPQLEGAKVVALESSRDLETWKQVATVTSFSDQEFFRANMVEID